MFVHLCPWLPLQAWTPGVFQERVLGESEALATSSSLTERSTSSGVAEAPGSCRQTLAPIKSLWEEGRGLCCPAVPVHLCTPAANVKPAQTLLCVTADAPAATARADCACCAGAQWWLPSLYRLAPQNLCV